jgi:hypothetical protein
MQRIIVFQRHEVYAIQYTIYSISMHCFAQRLLNCLFTANALILRWYHTIQAAKQECLAATQSLWPLLILGQ